MDEMPEVSKAGKLTSLLNTIALWLILGVVGCYLLFKPDNTLNKDTVEKLSNAVETIAVASSNMTKAANDQREWYTQLTREFAQNKNKRDDGYEDLYGKYGYSDSNTALSLDDIYNHRLQQQAENNGGRDVRQQQNGTGQTRAVQKPAGSAQGQSN